MLPDVPVIVTVADPVVAAALAVKVTVLVEVAGFGLKLAVTPLGKPDADKVTLPLKPLDGVMVIVLALPLPCTTLKLLGEAEIEKLGEFVTVKLIVVVWVMLPDVPVTVTVAVPMAAVALAVRVKVLVEVAGFGLKLAVTPLGKPDADKVTFPLKPLEGLTVIVVAPLVPWTTLRLLGEADIV
jgi:hypothetical protein